MDLQNEIVHLIKIKKPKPKISHALEDNTYYVGDNLDLLKRLGNETVDMIYFDPPYNTGRHFFDFDD
jgi:DNA modification methylase